MTAPRHARPGAAVAVAVALVLGAVLVVLAAHVTPDGYRGHAPLRTYLPDAPSASPSSGSLPPRPASGRRGSGNVAELAVILLILAWAAAVVTIIVVVASWLFRRRRRTLRLRRDDGAAGPTRAELAQRLADSIDESLADLELLPVSEAVIACWVRLHDTVRATGITPEPSDTPEEFVTRVLGGAAAVAPADALQRLADLYREARFSAHPMTPAHRVEAEHLLRTLRDALRGYRVARADA